MEKSIRITDVNGSRMHLLSRAAKGAFETKVGTVVITDLRVAAVPTGMKLQKSLKYNGLELSCTMGVWYIQNDLGESVSSSENDFHLEADLLELKVYF